MVNVFVAHNEHMCHAYSIVVQNGGWKSALLSTTYAVHCLITQLVRLCRSRLHHLLYHLIDKHIFVRYNPFSERTDLSYPPVITALNGLGPAADFLAPGDRIHQIDGMSMIGLSNAHVLSVLMNGDQPAVVEIEYCLPEYSKSWSFWVNKENGLNTIVISLLISFPKQFMRHIEISPNNGGTWEWLPGPDTAWWRWFSPNCNQCSTPWTSIQSRSHQTRWSFAARG